MKNLLVLFLAGISFFSSSVVVAGFFEEIADTPVSAFELLTVGEKYDGWRVRVYGILLFTKDRSLLFVSQDAYRMRDEASSIYLDLSGVSSNILQTLKDANGKGVVISGVFQDEKRDRNTGVEMTFGPPYKGRVEVRSLTVLQ